MSLLQRVCKTLGVLGLAVAVPSLVVFAQASTAHYALQGGEFAPAGSMAGDQTHPSLNLNTSGGFLVWQDNVTDGSGLGISAIRLDSTFSSPFGSFRVNQQGTNDQENPQVSLLKNGGAAFVWQGGKQSFQHIYARFLNSSNTFVGGDVQVNTATNYQANPAMATLTNGNVIVAWGSFGQDNSDGFQGVYAQLLSPTGQKINGEFLINQYTSFNQRTPAVAAFPNGNFIIAWVSEKERSSQSVSSTNGMAGGGNNSVDVYARLFSSAGTPLGNEFLVNTGTNICANPSVAVASDNTFVIAWGEKDKINFNNSWDVYSRQFSSAGTGGAVVRVNTQRYGDQYAPKVSSLGTDYLIAWTSMGQDGSQQGVYAQFLLGDGSHAGGEFRVNTTVLNQQEFQAVASDGGGRFLAVWSSYVGGLNSMDLKAQRYATTLQPLSAPGAPVVTAVEYYKLNVAWPLLAGFNVNYYELFVDGSTTPTIVSNNIWSNPTDYSAASTHTFQLAYVLTDGRQSPLSPIASGKTWGNDGNHDGLPDDWQTMYWGSNQANWPSPNTRLTPNGPTVLQVYLWGANPLDPSTWFKESMSSSPEGLFLNWTTVPGGVYQVLSSTNSGAWNNLGSPRFAAGSTDSIFLGQATANPKLIQYKVFRFRY